jgi:hypothetical protein
LSITIHTPKKLIQKHLDLFIIAVGLFLIGFFYGLQPKHAEPIIRQAKEIPVDPYATLTNIKAIFVNNMLISIVSWLGWFMFLLFGLKFFPPLIMVYNVGAAYGAVASYVSSGQFILTLAIFGVVEAIGLIFGLMAGLLFPKYILMKILGRDVSIVNYAQDSLSFMLYSAITLLIGAFLESLLLNPVTAILGLICGLLTSISLLYFIFKGE